MLYEEMDVMEARDVIIDNLLNDIYLMDGIMTEIEDLESRDNFESSADYDDYIAECMTWDYTTDEDAHVENILWQYGYDYDIKPSTSYNLCIRNDIIIRADEVTNINVLRQFCSNIAIWIDQCQEPAKLIYTGKTFRIIIDFE